MHLPLTVSEAPLKNHPSEHTGWSLHAYVLDVPPQPPVVYWSACKNTLIIHKSRLRFSF